MEAQEYEKLVKALRYCSKDKCGQCEYEWNHNREFCMNSMCADAADAIEALQAEVKRLNMRCADCEYGNSEWPEDPEHTKMPKRGEWIEDTTTYAGPGLSNYKCSLCGKICGTWRRGLKPSELPNWCGNCGADMRKTEVRE